MKLKKNGKTILITNKKEDRHLVIKTDGHLYDLELFKNVTNTKTGLGKSYKFVFYTERRKTRSAIEISTLGDNSVSFYFGEISRDNEFVGNLDLHNKEIIKFSNTLTYCLKYFSSHNPQFIWYNIDKLD
jgi:hypothetical protein